MIFTDLFILRERDYFFGTAWDALPNAIKIQTFFSQNEMHKGYDKN